MKRLYHAQKVSLYHGDSLDVLTRLKAKGLRFDGLISDPPYSSGGTHTSTRQGSTSSKYQSSDAQHKLPDFLGDNMDQRSYRAWATLWLSEAVEMLRPGGIVCLFTDWRQLPTISDVLQGAGVTWRGVAAWDKVNGRPRLGGFNQQIEFLVWGSKGRLERQGPSLSASLRCPMVPTIKRVHFAEKPLELMREILRLVAWRDSAAVLDPFAGGATTLLAARQLGIKAVGIEKCPTIAEIARKRLQGSDVAAAA